MPPGGAPPRPPKPGGRSPAPVFEGGVDVGSGLGQRSEVVRLLLRDPKPENQRKGNRLPRGESRAARAHYEAKGRSRDRMGHERGRTSHVNRLRVGVFVRVDRCDRGSAVLSAGRDCDMAIRSWPLIGGDDEILLEKKQHSLISHKKVLNYRDSSTTVYFRPVFGRYSWLRIISKPRDAFLLGPCGATEQRDRARTRGERNAGCEQTEAPR